MEINEKISFNSYADLIEICAYNEDEGIIASMSPQEALVLAAVLTKSATRILTEK
jgi:hypothetical protein